jgi:hypothetical protein
MPSSKDPYSTSELVEFLIEYSTENPRTPKREIALATAMRFGLEKHRSVYVGAHFAIRFSSASSASFSNVVLSLSALRALDNNPFLVCIVRPTGLELLLVNSTFLKKISHSSHQLRINNVRGSFLGHDILRIYGDLTNKPSNFDKMFSAHQEFAWEENLERLVEATNNIAPTGIRFDPTDVACENILASANIAYSLSNHPEYLAVEAVLREIVHSNEGAIIEAAIIDNVNERGNKIEQLITQGGNLHGVEDITFSLDLGPRVLVDVKTKILTLTSSPKGYNIDKLLRTLSGGNTVFSFFFVGIAVSSKEIRTRLVSFLDRTILNATRIQFHWAGRNSRGVTQLTGDFSRIFEMDFCESIDLSNARVFLEELIELE